MVIFHIRLAYTVVEASQSMVLDDQKMTDFADWPLLTLISATPMDSRVLPLETWNKMETIPYKARDIHRDQCRNFSFFKDAPILIRQISIPFQLTNFTDRELAKFQSFIQEVSNKNNKKHPFYSNIEPGQRSGLIKWFVPTSTDFHWYRAT